MNSEFESVCPLAGSGTECIISWPAAPPPGPHDRAGRLGLALVHYQVNTNGLADVTVSHDSDPVLPVMVTGWLAGPSSSSCPLARAAQIEPGPDCRAQQRGLERSALYARPLAPGRPGPWPSGLARVSCISLHTSVTVVRIQVWMYVYVSKCMLMYLHVHARICTYLHVCHIHWRYAKYNCIHDLGVRCVCIWMYVYVFICILYVFARTCTYSYVFACMPYPLKICQV